MEKAWDPGSLTAATEHLTAARVRLTATREYLKATREYLKATRRSLAAVRSSLAAIIIIMGQITGLKEAKIGKHGFICFSLYIRPSVYYQQSK